MHFNAGIFWLSYKCN